MFIWYTQERLSVGQITDRLTKLRVPTPSDRGRKVAQRERGVGQWSKSSVARILRCPIYTGVMYHFRYRRAKKSTNVTKRPEQDWVGVPVPVIIDKAIWEVAQRRLDEGRSLSKRNGKRKYLLGRRIRCQCGYAIFGTSDRWQRWYRCGGRSSYAVHRCNQNTLRQGRLRSEALAAQGVDPLPEYVPPAEFKGSRTEGRRLRDEASANSYSVLSPQHSC